MSKLSDELAKLDGAYDKELKYYWGLVDACTSNNIKHDINALKDLIYTLELAKAGIYLNEGKSKYSEDIRKFMLMNY